MLLTKWNATGQKTALFALASRRSGREEAERFADGQRVADNDLGHLVALAPA
jgi:hypothetical protein